MSGLLPSISHRIGLLACLGSAWLAGLARLGVAAPQDSDSGSGREESIEIVVLLEEGRYYSVRELCRQCNEKLGDHYPLDRVPDVRRELTSAQRLALLLLAETDLVGVQIDADRLVISLPNAENDEFRRRHRDWLRRWFRIQTQDWPEGMGLHVPEAFDPHARTVLLVHGLESGRVELSRLEEAFRAARVQVLTFDYPNDGPPAWAGERLSRELRALAEQHAEFRCAAIGHSLGGLIARYALETPELDPGCVTDLIALGTPHQGTRLAAVQEWMELFYAMAPADSAISGRPGFWQDGLGEAATDMTPGSEFLKRLNLNPKPSGVRYHSAAGRKSFLTDAQRDAMARKLRAKLDTEPERGVRRKLLALLESDELRDGRGDGAVSVASARFVQGRARVFDLNHLELLHPPGDNLADTELFGWMLETLGWDRIER